MTSRRSQYPGHRGLPPDLPKDRVARFWGKVATKCGQTPEDCWLWLGSLDRYGYGRFSLSSKKRIGAHKFSLELALGHPLEPGQFACHTCDNRDCVRPEHLYAGSPRENVRDIAERGRQPDPYARIAELERELAAARGHRG